METKEKKQTQEAQTNPIGKWITVTCPSGREVQIRKMKLMDEDIVTDTSLARTGENVDALLANCTSLSREELLDALMGDRMFLMVEIRKLRSELMYPTIECEKCGANFEDEVDLSKLRLQKLDKDLVDGKFQFDMTLPVSGQKLTARLLRGKDERTIFRARRDHGNRLMTFLTMLRTASIEGVKVKKLDWFREMDGDDAAYFREEYEKHDCGYDTEIETSCKSCGRTVRYTLPFDVTFFLGGRRKRQGI